VLQAGRAAAIEKLIEDKSFAVLARLQTTLSIAQVAELYEEHEGKPFFTALCKHMSAGPLVALVLEKANAISEWLELLGPEDAEIARAEAPTSIRAVYGTDAIKNGAHGSKSAAAAFRELKFFFPKVFPREYTLTLLPPGSPLVSEAVSEGFLIVLKDVVTLSVTQAEAFCSTAPPWDTSATADKVKRLSEVPVECLLLEKPFAVESWLAMPGSKTALHSSVSPVGAVAEAVALFGTEKLEKIETTFAFIKPDAFANAPSILAIAEANGFTVLASMSLTLSKEQVQQFYPNDLNAEELSAFMSSGPSLALVLQRPLAVSAWNALCGPSDSQEAKHSHPLSLRALFGTDGLRNACHASQTAASAAMEAAFFFPELAQPQTTLALLTPDADVVDEVARDAANAGLVITDRVVTVLDEARATDFLDMLGDAAPPHAPSPPPPEIFISAWVEGGGMNKALQLYNPSSETIMLDTGYALGWLSAKNPNAGKQSNTIECEKGKYIPPNGVFCFYHPLCSTDFKALLPPDEFQSQAINMGLSNGNDGMALLREADGGHEVLDYLGDFTQTHKRTPWSVAGTKHATKDHTLVRKSHISVGNHQTWQDPALSSQGTSVATSEWIVYPKNTYSCPGWTLSSWASSQAPPPPPPTGSYEAAVALLTSGPVVALALSGMGAVARWNALLGPEDPLVAKVRCSSCLRARFGTDATRNVGHGSGSLAVAFDELKFFFSKLLADPLPSNKEAKNFVNDTISPTLTAGLVELCEVKPKNPVEWLANWLIANNPNKPQFV